MKNWLYNNNEITSIEELPQDAFGFIYITTHIQKESDWKTYFGSSKPILEIIKDGKIDEFERQIIQVVNNKKLLTYYECKYLFKYGVLEHPLEYFNDNILGKFFTRDFGLLKED